MKQIYKYLSIVSIILVVRITFLLSYKFLNQNSSPLPLIINTWNFKEANEVAWTVLHKGTENEALEALVEGLTACERLQCDGTVGFGGSPDERGETTLDAMIMDGKDQNMGAVAGMKDIKNAAKVARHVLENTEHSLLVGEAATEFAEMMGFQRESLATKDSLGKWFHWFSTNCQPNFWKNVSPDPKQHCGPYKPQKTDTSYILKSKHIQKIEDRNIYGFGEKNHDTIGMIVVNKKGEIYAGTSTNGAIHKIPGRVGDSPIPGAGAFADNEVGAAVATGDGDIMMRFLPSFMAVEMLRSGVTPDKAAESVMKRILKKYPLLSGAIVVTDKLGNYGTACAGMKNFPYSIVSGTPTESPRVQYKECLKKNEVNVEVDMNDLKDKTENLIRRKQDSFCQKLQNEVIELRSRLKIAEKIIQDSHKEKGDF